MRSAKSLLGMPVIHAGRRLGLVAYVMPDEDFQKIHGLYLHCGLTGSRFIECAQLDMIGEVAVLAHAAGRRSPLNQRPLFRRALAPDGQRIGAITDTLIDENSLCIEALELSHGYLDDLALGRTHVRQFSICKNGDIIVGNAEGGNQP